MTALTVQHARKILGALAKDISDEEVAKDIKVAEIIKTLFFQKYLTTKRLPNNYNKTNGKT